MTAAPDDLAAAVLALRGDFAHFQITVSTALATVYTELTRISDRLDRIETTLDTQNGSGMSPS